MRSHNDLPFSSTLLVIVSWFNEDQGNITGFANASFDINLNIPIEANQWEGAGATVTSLTVIQSSTTVPGEVDYPDQFYNFTDDVYGTVLEPGKTYEAEMNIEINLAVERTYNFLVSMEALGANGRPCTGTDLISFTAGGSPASIGIGSGCPELDRFLF